MKKIKTFTPVLALAVLMACAQKAENKAPEQKQQPGMPAATEETTKPQRIVLNKEDLADAKDLVCGMPAFKFLKDTAVLNGKIYGFCSTGCKDEFLKDPKAYVKN